jgi:hypothetical protein
VGPGPASRARRADGHANARGGGLRRREIRRPGGQGPAAARRRARAPPRAGARRGARSRRRGSAGSRRSGRTPAPQPEHPLEQSRPGPPRRAARLRGRPRGVRGGLRDNRGSPWDRGASFDRGGGGKHARVRSGAIRKWPYQGRALAREGEPAHADSRPRRRAFDEGFMSTIVIDESRDANWLVP